MDFLTSEAIDLRGLRPVPIVHDERFDHYPEFGAALVRAWELAADISQATRYYRAAGGLYEVSVWANARGFPAEARLTLWAPAYDGLAPDAVDAGAWAFLAWLLRAAGGDWSVLDPDRFARRFAVPTAP